MTGLKVGNKRWFIVFLLVLAYTFMYLGRSSISIAGSTIMKDYGWSATQFGLVSTAFFIGYAITMLPAGFLADKFGAGKVIVVGTLVWSLFTLLSPFAGSIGLFVLIRAMVGVGQGVTLPSASSMVSKWVPKQESGRAQGFTLIGVPLGVAITMPLGVYLIQHFNWQTIFYIFSILGPVWCLVWWKFGKDRPELHSKISKEEVAYIKAGQGTKEVAGVALTAKEVYGSPSVWGATLGYFCYNYVFYLLLTWLPTYFAQGRNLSLADAGYATMFPYLVAVFTYPIGGMLADWGAKKFGQNIGRKLFPVIGLIFGGIALMFATQTSSLTTAILLLSVSMGGLTLTQGGFFSIPIILAPKNAGMIVGLYGFIGTFAGITAPILTGFVIDVSGKYETAMYLGSGMAILGAVILLTLAKIKPIEQKQSIGIKAS
ncbi:MFS transporter [Bacillus sp. 1NLA3E]|uniref:MFS transporter n=1 Tax=Bacillus sp. 1NLA3E TaxID=666686 RepID=UPI000247E6C8|nr:MFS transporter [Bacillus sp. 1NLA3E]AGK53263.1 transporter protein [Bacillus sp. 1NLA3E]